MRSPSPVILQKLPEMNWRENLNSPFPFYLNDDRKNIGFIGSISLFVVFFLHVYHPEHGNHVALTIPQKFLFGGVTFTVLFINIVVLPKIYPRAFDPTSWTVKKYIWFTLFHCVLIGLASTLIDEFIICPQRSLWENIVGANTQVAQTGLIVITIMTLFLRNNLLKQNLKSAIRANLELDKIKTLKKEVARQEVASVLTIYSETSETLSFHLPHLLFVEADDNYSTIVWRNESGIQKKLLRVNLKNMESQINNDFVIRCHRSYIVNVHAISNIAGNTNGYKLHILDTDITIPVSRPKGKDVIEKIHQLKSMMELA